MDSYCNGSRHAVKAHVCGSGSGSGAWALTRVRNHFPFPSGLPSAPRRNLKLSPSITFGSRVLISRLKVSPVSPEPERPLKRETEILARGYMLLIGFGWARSLLMCLSLNIPVWLKGSWKFLKKLAALTDLLSTIATAMRGLQLNFSVGDRIKLNDGSFVCEGVVKEKGNLLQPTKLEEYHGNIVVLDTYSLIGKSVVLLGDSWQWEDTIECSELCFEEVQVLCSGLFEVLGQHSAVCNAYAEMECKSLSSVKIRYGCRISAKDWNTFNKIKIQLSCEIGRLCLRDLKR